MIEQRQRDATAKRKAANEEHAPRFFEADYSDGRPRLTEEGRRAVEAELVRGKP